MLTLRSSRGISAVVDIRPFVALRGSEHVSLTHMAVSASMRTNGVGRALFERVVDWAKDNDRHEV